MQSDGKLQFFAVPELNQPTESTEARPRDFHLETAERPQVPPRAPFTLLSCPLSCVVVLFSILVTAALSLKPINELDAHIALKELIQVKDLQVIGIVKQADRAISKLDNPCCLRGANAASPCCPLRLQVSVYRATNRGPGRDFARGEAFNAGPQPHVLICLDVKNIDGGVSSYALLIFTGNARLCGPQRPSKTTIATVL